MLRGAEADPSGDVALVQPFVGETTALVIKIDPARLALPAATAASADEPARVWRERAGEALRRLRAATGGPLYATIGIPYSQSHWPVFVFVKDGPSVNRQLLLDDLAAIHSVQSAVHGGMFVMLPEQRLEAAEVLVALTPSPRVELSDAFRAAGSYPLQVLLLPPDYVRRTVSELMPELPRHLGGGPSDVLTHGVVWAALGADPGALRVELVIQSASASAATDLAAHLPKMLRSAYDEIPALQQRVPRTVFETLLPLIAPRVEGSRVVLRLDGSAALESTSRLLAAAVGAVQSEMRRETTGNRLKQILLAMHNYHDSYKMFPPRDEVRDSSGRSGLSWRVHLLPFLDEQELFRQFHLDEPWDSPHNAALIARMPQAFASRAPGIAPGHTTFLAPAGEDTVFGGPQGVRINQIIDGTSNTVVLLEVKPERAVPWTAPQDYAFDDAAPGQGLAIDADGRFFAGFADGSVRRLRGDAEAVQLRRLFRKSDQEPVEVR
jgi:hypothetical protein